MSSHNVLLIWPPAGSVHGPPLGLAAIAGHLREKRPDCQLQVVDLNVRLLRDALKALDPDEKLGRTIRSRWTQADIVQDAISRWTFGPNAPSGIGALPDWECHYLSLLFGRTMDGFLAAIKSEPGLIGISVCDNGFIASLGLTRRLRRQFPLAKIVWGGVSMSVLQAPLVLNAIPELDAVVAGEGEDAILSLVDALPELPGDGPPGLWTRSCPGARELSGQHYLISEPAYDLFDLSLYPALELPVSIGRGCAWGRCAFCNENFATSDFQEINAEKSAEWALRWQEQYRPVSFDLVDSAANSNRGSFRLFVEGLKTGGGLREWRCMMRTAGLDREDLIAAVEAGLRTVYFGVESLDDEILHDMEKGETVAHHLLAFRMALELGLRVEGDLILFFPTDTPEAVDRGIEIIRRYDHIFCRVDISFSRFVPGIRSKTWEYPEEYGIKHHPWSLRLARHLPMELSKKIKAWDPYWEFVDRSNESVISLSEAYLRLQRVIAKVRVGQHTTRTSYRMGKTIVLEVYGHDNDALDRVFLEGLQASIWDALGDKATTEALAHSVDVSFEDIEKFLIKLESLGFVFRRRHTWFNLTFSSERGSGLALRNCASRPELTVLPQPDITSDLARLCVD